MEFNSNNAISLSAEKINSLDINDRFFNRLNSQHFVSGTVMLLKMEILFHRELDRQIVGYYWRPGKSRFKAVWIENDKTANWPEPLLKILPDEYLVFSKLRSDGRYVSIILE